MIPDQLPQPTPMPDLEQRLDAVSRHLKLAGGGGTSGGMEPASREYVDLKLTAAITEVSGKFDMLNQRLGDLERRMPSIGSMILTAAGAVVSALGLGLAILAFAGDRFDGGLGLADKRQEQLEVDRAQNGRIEQMLKQLTAQSASPATPAIPAGATSAGSPGSGTQIP